MNKNAQAGESDFRQVGFVNPERKGEARLAPEIAEANEARSPAQHFEGRGRDSKSGHVSEPGYSLLKKRKMLGSKNGKWLSLLLRK